MQTFESKLNQIITKIKTASNGDITILIELYKNASTEEQGIIRGSIDRETSEQLISYSHLAAVECVRKQSKKILFNGIIAQAIENAKIDYRDNIGNLFLLYHSAKRIHEDPNLLIREAIQLSSKAFGKILYDFLGRSDLDSDIVKLSGYKAVDKPEFDYVWAG